MIAVLEAFLFSGYAANRSITVTKGASSHTSTLATSSTVRDALAYWQDDINAAAIGTTATFSYSTTTGAITLGFSASTSVVFEGTLNLALGFSSASLSAGTSHVSDETPRAIVLPYGITYDAPVPIEDVTAVFSRWGRGKAYAWYATSMVEFEVFIDRATLQSVERGPLFNGKVRVSVDSTASTAYATNNLTGYLDLFISEIKSRTVDGVVENLARVLVVGTT